MSHLLESGELQNHIVRDLQPAYARRYYSLMSAINKYLVPLGVELPQEDRDHMGCVSPALEFPSSNTISRSRYSHKTCLGISLPFRLMQ